jgi:hypothetical protein
MTLDGLLLAAPHSRRRHPAAGSAPQASGLSSALEQPDGKHLCARHNSVTLVGQRKAARIAQVSVETVLISEAVNLNLVWSTVTAVGHYALKHGAAVLRNERKHVIFIPRQANLLAGLRPQQAAQHDRFLTRIDHDRTLTTP